MNLDLLQMNILLVFPFTATVLISLFIPMHNYALFHRIQRGILRWFPLTACINLIIHGNPRYAWLTFAENCVNCREIRQRRILSISTNIESSFPRLLCRDAGIFPPLGK